MAVGGKVAISLVSLILVVGVVIGAVAFVRLGNDSASSSAGTSMKAVSTFCDPTSYKDACAKSVEPAAKNATATPKDYIIAALQATIEHVKDALHVTDNTKIDQDKDPYHHMAVEDCKELLGYAVQELQAALSTVGDSQLHTLNDRADELLNWLTAVYTYQTDCLDGFQNPEYKSPIENGMVNATQLTNNAVDIIAKLTDLLKAFNVPILQKPDSSHAAGGSSRRLLQTNEVGHEDDYPTWFQAADRELLAANAQRQVVPNAVVAKDGSGKFKTITDALRAYPPKLNGRYIIYVKAGVYQENVIVDKKQTNVFIYGDGAGKTVVTGNKNFEIMHIQTSNTATFAALGDGFIAKGMTFENTAGPEGHQAVALRIQSDMAAVFDCSVEGFQDTLYYQTHRQFYRNCMISGTIDFIFGKGSAVIQNSLIVLRKGLPNQFNTVTADGKELQNARTGLVLQNCRIIADQFLFPARFQIASYLGRPWKQFAKTVVMQSEIADVIRPEGYKKWDGEAFEKSCEYLEFGNRGPAAATSKRNFREFTKSRAIGPGEANQYTVNSFLQAGTWLPATGAPFTGGLRP